MRNLKTYLAAIRNVVVALTMGTAPLVCQAAEQTVFYHLDALGSPVAATDEGGAVLWREEYRPYGDKIQNDPASAINSRAFTGHPHDNTTGLTYTGARHYDPVVGRFMGVDPAPFGENNIHSFNRYAYGNNNPYKYVDPNGEAAILLLVPAVVYGGFQLLTHSDYANAPAQGQTPVTLSSGDHIGVVVDAAPGRAFSMGKTILHATQGKGNAERERSRSIEKGIPESALGPSGRPKRHTVEHSTRKEAQQAAAREVPEGGEFDMTLIPPTRDRDRTFRLKTRQARTCARLYIMSILNDCQQRR